jgi:hypothetical protein
MRNPLLYEGFRLFGGSDVLRIETRRHRKAARRGLEFRRLTACPDSVICRR